MDKIRAAFLEVVRALRTCELAGFIDADAIPAASGAPAINEMCGANRHIRPIALRAKQPTLKPMPPRYPRSCGTQKLTKNAVAKRVVGYNATMATFHPRSAAITGANTGTLAASSETRA
jgi:hypothetical protein